MKPKTYKERPGCHNCTSMFHKWEYDERDEHFCTFGAPARPPCMSGGMHEYPQRIHRDEEGYTVIENPEHYEHRLGQAGRDWEAWKQNRGVELWGFCDEHTQSK